ncbi:MAG: polyprenyl synthetase family protein [Clostridium sp.]
MRINQCKEKINQYLKDYYKDRNGYNKIIFESSSYSLIIGGKRIRPILLFLTYNMYKEKWEDVLEMGAAIEMIHTYSLIHDDLPSMDNDDLRRGEPTNHKVFGENIAILAGDALLNEAMLLMMKFSLEHNDMNALRASYEIAEAAGADGMIGGQVVDIINEGKKISKEELEYMHLKKTGELIRSSIVAGAILANAEDEDIEILNQYGKNLGLAFQIKDDILDIVGNVELLGKNTNSDIDNDKTNFVSLYGLEFCQKECKRLTEESINLLNRLTVDAKYLKELTLELLNREY